MLLPAPFSPINACTSPGATVSETNKGSFSEYRFIGQADASGDDANRPKPGPIQARDVLPPRTYYKSALHAYKPKTVKDKHSRDVKQCRNAALLLAGSHASKAYVITGKVDGWLSRYGYIWTAGTMVRVVLPPEQEGIDEPMYLLERTLHMDSKGGQTADLTFIPKGALILGEKFSA